jgi:hypothetical protein
MRRTLFPGWGPGQPPLAGRFRGNVRAVARERLPSRRRLQRLRVVHTFCGSRTPCNCCLDTGRTLGRQRLAPGEPQCTSPRPPPSSSTWCAWRVSTRTCAIDAALRRCMPTSRGGKWPTCAPCSRWGRTRCRSTPLAARLQRTPKTIAWRYCSMSFNSRVVTRTYMFPKGIINEYVAVTESDDRNSDRKKGNEPRSEPKKETIPVKTAPPCASSPIRAGIAFVGTPKSPRTAPSPPTPRLTRYIVCGFLYYSRRPPPPPPPPPPTTNEPPTTNKHQPPNNHQPSTTNATTAHFPSRTMLGNMKSGAKSAN